MQRDEGAGESHEPADDRADEPADEGRAEAAAWAAIVANFGERAVLDPADEPDTAARSEPAPSSAADPGPDPDDAIDALLEEEQRFVPPDPPPVPMPPPDRLAAWIGVFGSPAVLLVCLVVGVTIPTLLGWALVIGFIGGFCYLLARSPGTPRDPGDDGSRV